MTQRLLALCALPMFALAAQPTVAQSLLHIPGTTSVGSSAAPQPVPVTVTTAGQVSSIRVLSQGSAQSDFRDAGNGTCSASTYGAGAVCTVNVIFTPVAPGRRTGAVVLAGANGEVLASQLLDGMAMGPLAVIQPGKITTAVGSGEWLYRGDNSLATSSQIFLPTGVVVSPNGDITLSDSGNNRIRRVDGTSNLISTYAGIGTSSAIGDGGLATQAGVNNPAGLALDGAGNIYLADSGNNAIRRIDASSRVMTTVAGTLGTSGFTGDGGPATAATLNGPNGVTLDVDGNLYIADTLNNAIRRVDAITHVITTIAGGLGAGSTGDKGPAVAAMLNAPYALAIGPDGTLYIADQANNVVRRIDAAGVISTVAGKIGQQGFTGDGGIATSATLRGPGGIVLDPAGNLYISDSINGRLRRVDAKTGNISTIAGAETAFDNGDGLNANLATLSGPTALFFDGNGNLFIGDMFHNRLRRISATEGVLQYPVMRVSKTSAPQIETIQNNGNSALTLGQRTLSQSKIDTNTTTCTTTPLAAGLNCNFGVQFAPTQVGDAVVGSAAIASDSPNSPVMIGLFGQVLTVEPTAVLLTSDTNPAAPGQTVLLTATVTSADSGRGGSVTFLDGTTELVTVPLNTNGIATFSTTGFALGSHSLTAAYSGDANNASSISNIVVENVRQSTSIALQSSSNPSDITKNITLRAVISAAVAPVRSGSIEFFDGSTSLGVAAIQNDSTATVSTASLSAGNHSITAVFAGDTNSLASRSDVLTQVVNFAPTTTLLAVSPAVLNVGELATFTATITNAVNLRITGSVTFYSGPTALGTANVNANGTATFQTAGLTPGTNTITAAYSGDASNGRSTTAGSNITVNRLQTVTLLSTSSSPADAGTPLRLTASVTLSPGLQPDGPLTGSVTFYDGGLVLGTQTLDGNGSASLSTSSLSVGAHTLSAVYSGSTNYAVSTSAAVAQVVRQSTTTTSLSPSSNNVVAGLPLTLTASVSVAGVPPTGTVNFTDENGVLGSAALNGSGVSSITITNVPPGSHVIVATYAGDSNYTTSSSPGVPVAIRKGDTTLALLLSATDLSVGDTLRLSTTLASDGVVTNGSLITLTDGATTLAALNVNAQGVATYSTASLGVGSHTLTATFAGDSVNNATRSQTVTVTVKQATSSTVLTTNASPAAYGTVVLQAQVSSSAAGAGGIVTFREDSGTLGTAALNASGIATLALPSLTVGSHAIQATYAGDTNHSGSTSAVLTQAVVQTTAVSLISSGSPAVAGRVVTFTAQVGSLGASNTSAQAGGSVTFFDGASALATVNVGAGGVAAYPTSSLTVGTHTITARYSGDALFQASTSPSLTQAVNSATTQAALVVGANPATYGTNLSLRAVVTGIGAIPTGSVAFKDGSATLGQASLGADGTVTIATSTLSPGSHVLSVVYGGDSRNDTATSASVTVQVQQSTQTAVVSNANPALTLQDITLTASVRNAAAPNATGTVVFSDGTTVLGTATLSATGVATLPTRRFAAGTHAITAAYSGDAVNFASNAPVLTLVVQLRTTTNALTASAPSAASGGVLSLISVLQYSGPAVPTGTMVFRSGTGVIGSSRLDAAGVATLSISASSIPDQVTATYSGDDVYSGSVSPATKVSTTSGSATNFSVTVDPTTITMASKKFQVVTMSMTSVGGFADTLSLGCLGLPYAATCTFEKDSVTLPANGTVSVKVTIDTGTPLTSGGASAQLRDTGSSNVLLAGLPLGALVGWLLLGGHRKRYGSLLLLLALFGSLFPMMGCGSISGVGTPAGSYAVKISAAALKSNVTVTQDVAMTVTQ